MDMTLFDPLCVPAQRNEIHQRPRHPRQGANVNCKTQTRESLLRLLVELSSLARMKAAARDRP